MKTTKPQDAQVKPATTKDTKPAPAAGSGAPDEKPDESALESLGQAITAPVRDAAEPDEQQQTGGR